jgi:uncharacterized protein (TIGR02246 family)
MSCKLAKDLTLAAFVSIAAARANAQTTPSSVRDSISAFYRAWSEASMTRGAEGYASYFATDATLLPPNAGPVHGRDSIRAWLDRTRREMTYRTVPSGITVDTVHVYGDFAIYLSTLKGQRIPLAGGSPVPFETKYFDVLQRSPTGGWQFRYRMWSDNLPARLPNQ